ncbi:Protein NO VEIN [Cladobotryum mycophilum]|uniref:Protein NO VEIN n=1 Tax=Cladobotryum mycophilum TaxID=491253 RepID=A0ABR0SIK3_9HYPO
MSSSEEAHRLVEEITQKHGYIRPEILESMAPEVRREVQMAMLMKDRLIASSVMTLAQNLYTSAARFVFELLQNADDNHYSRAKARGDIPWVSFHVHRDRIVIECNEDGFTPDNLAAICNIGKSSKTGAQGYIGEKGIGFKSVFMVAYKAYIQSGHFAFYFQHRKEDSGIGMITPIWERESQPLGNFSRITLFLHDEGDAADIAKQREVIRQQFLEIHDTILLFMKNLQEIRVFFYDDGGRSVDSINLSVTYPQVRRAAVARTCTDFSKKTSNKDVRHYHITKHLVTGLAKNENRTYSEEEEASKAWAKSEVVLAFPLSKKSAPIVGNQWLFAFLPVRQMGFKFIIQADFVTQANRQDIVTTSARNAGLVRAISEAFLITIIYFCQHSTLQFQWMRYLPRKEDYPWDSLWAGLIDMVELGIKAIPVLRPAAGNSLRRITDLKRNPNRALDKYGKPLFLDFYPDCYLALDYDNKDLDVLVPLGLENISIDQLLERVEHDLSMPTSRMKSIKDEDWHSRAAGLLQAPFEKDWKAPQEAMKGFKLLPLNNGDWISPSSTTVYFPKVAGTQLDIPIDLGLSVVSLKAATNPDRRKLFELLGVQEATVPTIRQHIKDKYQHDTPSDSSVVSTSSAVSHLRFLFLTYDLVSEPYYNYGKFPIISQHGEFEIPDLVDIYISNTDSYGGASLLMPTPPGPNPGDGAPGFGALFMNDAYFQGTPEGATTDGRSWSEWLYTSVGIRRHPRLLDWITDQLSAESEYIIENRPEKFLGFLKLTWEEEYDEQMENYTLDRELRTTYVLCQEEEARELSGTYIPTLELEAIVSRFMLPGEFFPWLELEDSPVYQRFPAEWEPLGRKFGLGSRGPNVIFAVKIFQQIKLANPDVASMVRPGRIYDLYGYLQAKIRETDEEYDWLNRMVISDRFEPHSPIFVPSGRLHPAAWAAPSDCVWSAPIEMKKKYSLERLYEVFFPQFDTGRLHMADFFQKTLSIRDCTWKDLVEEIEHFKDTRCNDADRIKELYKCLASMCQESNAEELKQIFQSKNLICGFEKGFPFWYNTSRCLWTGVTKIRGMLTLGGVYADLEDFFVGRLGVQTMTVEMVYEKLIARDGPKLSAQDAKETILAFNSLLQGKERELDPAPVLASQVFPVKLPNGKTAVWTSEMDFSLVDQKPLGDDFAARAVFLDFTMEEVRTLEPFVLWAGLDERYLTRAVKEKASVDPSKARRIYSPDRDMRMKAYALLRIAIAYKSPRALQSPDQFYTTLRNIKTLETYAITSELVLTQNKKQIRVAKKQAILHIHEAPEGVTIYVPRDLKQQEVCFSGKLARHLYEWMMADPDPDTDTPVQQQTAKKPKPAVVNVIQCILSAKTFALADILEQHGIGSIEVAEIEPERGIYDDHPTTEAVAPDTVPESSQPSGSNLERRDSMDSLYTAPETPVSALPGTPSPVPSKSTVQSPPSVGPAGIANLPFIIPGQGRNQQWGGVGGVGAWNQPISTMPVREDGYVTILKKVVDVARRARFPASELDFSQWEGNQQERDIRVGAAGELFVFEVLSHIQPTVTSRLELPNWSRDNWQSTIRKYVTCHPEYTDMKSWDGAEMADIVYHDSTGVLTQLFTQLGYIGQFTLAGPTPTYLIEVKSTTGPHNTPFFVSKSQYEKMHTHSDVKMVIGAPNPLRNTIYVIFRVFNVGKNDMGFKIYVDPIMLGFRDELSFAPDSWTVVANRAPVSVMEEVEELRAMHDW